jgi:hypothetical protein
MAQQGVDGTSPGAGFADDGPAAPEDSGSAPALKRDFACSFGHASIIAAAGSVIAAFHPLRAFQKILISETVHREFSRVTLRARCSRRRRQTVEDDQPSPQWRLP